MFNNLKFIPLAIPFAKCEPDKIKNYIDTVGKRTNYDWTRVLNNPWNHAVVRSKLLSPVGTEKPGSGWKPEFKELFPEVVNTVEQFPYKSISTVYLLEQLVEVIPHFDTLSRNAITHLEPATYRMVLLMEDTEAFYLCKDSECVIREHPVFPADTNSWVFSNKEFMHGSTLPKPGKRKILLGVAGELDEELHYQLLAKSIDKYKEYVIS